MAPGRSESAGAGQRLQAIARLRALGQTVEQNRGTAQSSSLRYRKPYHAATTADSNAEASRLRGLNVQAPLAWYQMNAATVVPMIVVIVTSVQVWAVLPPRKRPNPPCKIKRHLAGA